MNIDTMALDAIDTMQPTFDKHVPFILPPTVAYSMCPVKTG